MIHELKTAILFVGQEPDADAMNEEFSDYNWPPYRKVSSYDPFEDDPRLAVKFVEFSPHSKTLCVGGSGGQVITFSLNSLPSEIHLEVSLLWWKVYVLHVYMCILYMYSPSRFLNINAKHSIILLGSSKNTQVMAVQCSI